MPASVYAEVLVGPLRRREEQHIDAFMDRGAIRVIAADRQIARRAAQLRARHSALRLADALALATALEHEAELLTFDRRLRTIQEEHS
jgi:predicted nucleic acid-binding protein